MKKLKLQWISEIIGNEYEKWEKGDIVLLEAQTGTGKTLFIEDKLIPHLKAHEKLLLICNRTNLKRQMKIYLLNRFGQEKLIPCDKNGNLLVEGLDKITTINGNITIKSYQAISDDVLDQQYFAGGYLNKCDLSFYDYIVCDEVHFLLADGGFNNKCRIAHEELVIDYSIHAINIFISATMENVSDSIKSHIKKLDGYEPKLFEYNTGIDYSYLDIKYFNNNLDIIINKIKNDITDEKWLIFVSNKKDAIKIESSLGTKICSKIFSGSKSIELDSILNHCKFEKKVLVTTKVLDNGINIKDEKLANIVIMAWDKVTFIQELGRIRVDINNARNINLFIPLRYKKSFAFKHKICNNHLAEVDLHGNDETAFSRKYDNSLDKLGILNHLFYKDNNTGKWNINIIGLAGLVKSRNFFGLMTKRFINDGKFAFVYQQLEWLGLEKTFSDKNLIMEILLDSDIENFEVYLESLLNKKILKDEQLIIKMKLTNKAFKIDRSKLQGVKTMHVDTVNSILSKTLKLPYKILSKSTSTRVGHKPRKYSFWTIEKITENN